MNYVNTSVLKNTDMIMDLIKSSLQNTLKRANPNNKVSEQTLMSAELPSPEFVAKLKAKKKQDKTFLINNFHDIAWVDPFPDEEKIMADKQN